MTPGLRRAGLVALRVAVVGAALLFLLLGVAWTEVAGTLRSTNVLFLVAVVAVNGCMMVVKASRLRLFLGQGPSFKSCFLAKLTTSALNNVVPFRGGDVARVWMLERHARISKSAAAAVAVVEAIFELISLTIVALVGALALHRQRWAVGTASILVGAVVVGMWSLKRVNRNHPVPIPEAAPTAGLLGRIRGSIQHVIRRFIRPVLERVEPGTRALRKPQTVAVGMALSVGDWLLEMAMVMLCARAIQLPIGPALAAVTLLGINLAIALPSMPASAGAFESGAALLLVLSGIPKGPAVAFALLYHVVQVVPVTLAGLAVVSRAGVTLDRLAAPQSAE